MNKKITLILSLSFSIAALSSDSFDEFNLPLDAPYKIGEDNPIYLLPIDLSKTEVNLQNHINNGAYGDIYSSKNPNSKKIYKLIDKNNFNNTDEIRVNIIASELNISPRCYSTFLGIIYCLNKTLEYVVIEMDNGGSSLKDLSKLYKRINMKDLMINDKGLPVKMLDYCQNVKDLIANCLDIPVKEFNDQLLRLLYVLAKNKISYIDTHLGNILYNSDKRRFYLIDFDLAQLHPTIEQAAQRTANAACNKAWFLISDKKDYSEKSLNIIKWFRFQAT